MTTPMNLQYPVPGVGGTSGPLWAQQVNNNFSLIESHDHTSGKGSQIVAASVNIDADLTFNDHNATSLRSARLTNYASTGVFAAASTDKSCIFSAGGELYYRDQAGNSVQITSAGGVAGTPGSIGGLVAPAAVSWGALAGNLAFFADTGANTGMNLVAGGVSFADPAAGGMAGNLINLKAPASPSTYDVVLPAAAPSNGQVLKSDSSGNLSWFTDSTAPGRMPIGSVIATFPSLTGAYSCTNIASAGADASGFVVCGGSAGDRTINDATSPMNGQVVPNINNDVFLMGNTTSGTAGGANSAALPAHTHDLGSNGVAGITISALSGDITIYKDAGNTYTASIKQTATGLTTSSSVETNTVQGVKLSGRTEAITSAPTTDIRPSYISARFVIRIK